MSSAAGEGRPETLDWLYGTQLFGIKLGLAGVRALAGALGVDLDRPPFRVLHVAGTNGKGSTCAFAEAVARAHGFRTGLFTSPHLVRFNERLRTGGEPVSDPELAVLLAAAREACRGLDPHPTFFEIATVAALRHFTDRGVELAVLETGMGGRLDATNAASTSASLVTPVALDHQKWLGATLAAVAAEKAGIFKPGVPAFSAPQRPAAAHVLRNTAREVGAPLEFVEPLPPGTGLGLAGPHQRTNAALALAGLRACGIAPPEPVTARALAATEFPGRFQRAGDGLVIDGAHNPAASRALVATWRAEFPGERATVVFGSLESKSGQRSVNLLESIADRFVFTRPDSPRAADPSTFTTKCPSAVEPTLAAALGAARGGRGTARVLVTGSLYLAGEAVALLAGPGQHIEVSAQ